MSSGTTVSCPTCGASVTWNAKAQWRPFCSERCRLLDLGAWFTEERGIPGDDGEKFGDKATEPAIAPD